jgi:hypothetical protein
MTDLSNLPAEVRNAIYGQLFDGDSESRDRTRNELAIFTVSKQFHNEASSYFYENNDMVFNIPSLPTAIATQLPPVADRYLRFLKRVTLYVPTGPAVDLETPYIVSAIEAILSIGANLTELKLVLTSKISRYLNSRIDDSVLDSAHPVTNAIHNVIRANVVKVVRITLKNAWLASGVAQTLQKEFGAKVEFYQDDMLVQDVTAVERTLLGRYASHHLTNLGIEREDVSDLSRKRGTTPDYLTLSSSPSSLCSALSDLDMFSISSFESGADDAEASGCDEPFFAENDIEDWSASEQEDFSTDEDDFEMDLDEEFEDVPKGDVDAFMRNMDEVAQHKANQMDIEFLTNFAPGLLLSKAQLSHLDF